MSEVNNLCLDGSRVLCGGGVCVHLTDLFSVYVQKNGCTNPVVAKQISLEQAQKRIGLNTAVSIKYLQSWHKKSHLKSGQHISVARVIICLALQISE